MMAWMKDPKQQSKKKKKSGGLENTMEKGSRR
jgi:hypothetical protein